MKTSVRPFLWKHVLAFYNGILVKQLVHIFLISTSRTRWLSLGKEMLGLSHNNAYYGIKYKIRCTKWNEVGSTKAKQEHLIKRRHVADAK